MSGTIIPLSHTPLWANKVNFTCTIAQTRQTIYVQCNTEERSCNHFYSGETIVSTYSECVFVSFGIQYTMRMPHIVICGMSGSTEFFRIIIIIINCNLVVTLWQWLFYMYTKYEIGY